MAKFPKLLKISKRFGWKFSKSSHEHRFQSFGPIFAQDRRDVVLDRWEWFWIESGGKIT